MPVIPTRFPVEFSTVFPEGAFILASSRHWSSRRTATHPSARSATGRPTSSSEPSARWTPTKEAARFGAEFKVKIAAPQQPVPPAKAAGFPYAPAEFEGLTITPYNS